MSSCRVHLLLVTFIVSSWVLLFISISISDHHALRPETKVEIKEEIADPCDQCWPFGIRRNSSGDGSAEGIRKFYFHTLASVFTTLQVRLEMAKKVAFRNIWEVKQIQSSILRLQTMLNYEWICDRWDSCLNIKKKLFNNLKSPRAHSDRRSSDQSLRRNSTPRPLDGIRSHIKSTSSSESLSLLDLVTANGLVSVIVDGRKANVYRSILQLSTLYPQCQIHIIVNSSSSHVFNSSYVNHYFFPHTVTDSKAYNLVIEDIITPYTFLSFERNAFSEKDLFKRLIKVINELGVWASSGSLEGISGSWNHGCEVSSYRNYRAKWLKRRILFRDDCLLCHGLDGSFMALTGELQELAFEEELSFPASVRELFLRSAHQHHQLVASCPLITIREREEKPKFATSEMLKLAGLHNLQQVQFPGQQKLTITCSDMKEEYRHDGEIGSVCCMKELIVLIQFIMKTCEKYNIFCELQEGTLLGAVKFGSVLPWERDADITFLTANYSALQDLIPIFSSAGYKLKMTDNRWCCKDGAMAGGSGVVLSSLWVIEFWSQHAMDSAELIGRNELPTRVQVNNNWMRAPSNPGKHARNRYGHEIYRHVQHWMELGKRSSWEEYTPNGFQSCTRSGYHSCLDLFPSDGSLYLGMQNV